MRVSSTVLQSLKSFLQRDPNRLKTYVQAGLTVVDSAVGPLNALMKHLLIMQGLDPNSEPGAKRRRELEAALLASFNRLDDADFDADYDFSWLANKFSFTSKKLEHLKLTKDKFRDLTDLNDFGRTNPLSASVSSKYDSHTVTPPIVGPAVVEDPIGEPDRPFESKMFLDEKDETLNKVMKASQALRDFEENNPGVLPDYDHESMNVPDFDSPAVAFDPRDPSLERLKQLLERVESKFGQKLTDEAKAKLESILPGLGITSTEESPNKDESSRGAFKEPATRTSKKTANKTHNVGSFHRSPSKKG